MEEYEKIIVESDEETGADVYNRVIIDVLSDLALGRVLEKVRAYIDVKEPVFIFVALRRFGLPSIRLSDFAEVDMGDYGKNEVTINLLKESYIPQLLNKLWERYGKGNIDHSERSMIIVHTPDYFTEVDFLREMVIDEKIAQINDRIMDAMLRIIPEGFRVRYHQLTEEYILFVASEDPIKQEWKDKAFSIRNGLVKGGKDNA
ncbi:MAG: methanogenesis marker 17 protein [Candidatus Methanomarinus sp.]|jgi:putative methanogenesis marker protein 17|uniref:Methanogenesis marker 17 protein n=1 Tax=Candidatus Methanomarinus sp. TaxID=3386244 RepID=A0AC61S8X8_9EURY|nr:MAG: methanogenesis marker 17 protein [ANME-2 cluster archaeon]